MTKKEIDSRLQGCLTGTPWIICNNLMIAMNLEDHNYTIWYRSKVLKVSRTEAIFFIFKVLNSSKFVIKSGYKNLVIVDTYLSGVQIINDLKSRMDLSSDRECESFFLGVFEEKIIPKEYQINLEILGEIFTFDKYNSIAKELD